MVEINLLPWRDEKFRYQRKRIYYLCVGGALFSVLLMCAVHAVIGLVMVQQDQRVSRLRSKLMLNKSQGVPVELADHSAVQIISLFRKISKTAHAGMCYQRVRLDDNSVHLLGFSRSLQAVMTAWRQLVGTSELSALRVKEIKPEASGGVEFVLELPMHVDREEG